MGKMIQVRNVRPEVHEKLVRRAAARGVTLTALIEEILEREVATPTLAEALALIDKDEPVQIPGGAAYWVRQARIEDGREDPDEYDWLDE